MSPGAAAASFLAGREASARPRQPAGGMRWVAAAVVLVGVALSAWYTAVRTLDDYDPEIAVLVSRNNTTTWPRLVQSFSAAAQRQGCTASEAASENPGRLRIAFPGGGSVLFRLYKELGHAGMRERVRRLCERPRPPIAILSGANSGSARVVAEALHEIDSARSAPVYLISSGTVDELTSIHADKTFRFGHMNSRQAKDLVQRLLQLYAERGKDPPTLRVAVIQIVDDQFACEFTKLVKQELAAAAGADRVTFNDFKLPTAVGMFDDPTETERQHALKLAREMASAPGQEWVVVLPASADVVRRFWLSHYAALQEIGANVMALHFDNLTYLAGDSLDFADFSGPLRPSGLHAAALFYAQYDPRAPGSADPDAGLIREALYHEIAETVLSVLARGEARQSADTLRSALSDYRPKAEGPHYFVGPERRAGGGPVVVRSWLQSKFVFDFPPQMK